MLTSKYVQQNMWNSNKLRKLWANDIFLSLFFISHPMFTNAKCTWSVDTWPGLLTLWTLTSPTPSHNWSKSEPPNMATTTTPLSRHLRLENRTKPNCSAGTPHAGKPCWTHSYALILKQQNQNRGVEPTWSTTWWARHCILLQALVCQTFTPSTRRKGMPLRGVQKSATSRKGTFVLSSSKHISKNSPDLTVSSIVSNSWLSLTLKKADRIF